MLLVVCTVALVAEGDVVGTRRLRSSLGQPALGDEGTQTQSTLGVVAV
jgi:hypothetical protein